MLLRLAALCGLLPSVFATFANLIWFGPNFLRGGSKVPCIWHDGNVSSGEGEVSISIGPRSSFLVFTNGVETARACKTESTIVIEEPGTRIFIVTEKDGHDHGIKEHAQILHWIKLHSNESIFTTEQSNSAFDFAILETSNSFDSKSAVDPAASIDLTFSELESLLGLHSSPAGESNQARGLRSASFNQNPNANYIYDTDFSRNGIKVDKENSLPIYDSIPDRSNAENSSHSNVKWKSYDYSERANTVEQLKSPAFAEPLIYLSSRGHYGAYVISSLTGKVHSIKEYSTIVSEAEKIPEDTKMKIVMSARPVGSGKIYKLITEGSEVWYLKNSEKKFYQCRVRLFNYKYDEPILECNDLGVIWPANWQDIFPLEAAEMISEMGTFKPDLQEIAALNNQTLNKTSLRVNSELVFKPGMQLQNSSFTEPLIYLSPCGVNMVHVASSWTGNIMRLKSSDLCPVSDAEKIPEDKKMKIIKSSRPRNSMMVFKLITEGSNVWYVEKSEMKFYQCRVKLYSFGFPNPHLDCRKGVSFCSVNWNFIFPFEAPIDMIKEIL